MSMLWITAEPKPQRRPSMLGVVSACSVVRFLSCMASVTIVVLLARRMSRLQNQTKLNLSVLIVKDSGIQLLSFLYVTSMAVSLVLGTVCSIQTQRSKYRDQEQSIPSAYRQSTDSTKPDGIFVKQA